MSRICPITNERVLYLECVECEDKVCKRPVSYHTMDDCKNYLAGVLLRDIPHAEELADMIAEEVYTESGNLLATKTMHGDPLGPGDHSLAEYDREALYRILKRKFEDPIIHAYWKDFGQGAEQCTSCGMWAPFARYRKGQDINTRSLTDFCPHCGAMMDADPECTNCIHHDEKTGRRGRNGNCFACDRQTHHHKEV